MKKPILAIAALLVLALLCTACSFVEEASVTKDTEATLPSTDTTTDDSSADEDTSADNGTPDKNALYSKYSIIDTPNGFYRNDIIELTDSLHWFENIKGAIIEAYSESPDEISALCIPGSEWTYIDGYYSDTAGNKTPPIQDILLLDLVCVPEGSFAYEAASSDSSRIWLSEKVHRIEDDFAVRYYVMTDIEYSGQDCIAFFIIHKSDIQEGSFEALDCFFESMTIKKTTLRIFSKNNINIYQYDHSTLIIDPLEHDAFVLDSYKSDADFEARAAIDGKIAIRIHDFPNYYEILIDPMTGEVIDNHLDETAIAKKLGVSEGYISCSYYQYYSDTGDYLLRAHYLYSDRKVTVYGSGSTGKTSEKVTMLLYDNYPESDDDYKNFYFEIQQAIIYQDPNSASGISPYFGTATALYYMANDVAFTSYHGYCYYLSCLFTKESVEYLISMKDSFGNDYAVQSEDGILYTCIDYENRRHGPAFDKMILVEEDGYWKCDLLASLDNAG